MKIAFVCGSCEPGADGVGDYTITLAQALVKRGHACLVIALHDRHLDPPGDGHPQVAGLADLLPSLTCLRLGATLSWRERSRLLTAALRRFQPDWISLQYVPYAFNSKGLPWRLLPCLTNGRPFARWHVMAHELWVDPEAGLRNRLLAAIQQQLLRSLLHAIKPSAIHTSNSYYTHQLASIGWQASILPLFSSIPLSDNQAGSTPVVEQHPYSWSLIFFGSIHPEWNPDSLLSALKRAARESGISAISFTSIGNAGAHGRELWMKLAAKTPSWIRFTQCGVLPAREISLHLQRAHWGVTTTPSNLLGKSASVAAMLAHDLPVIVPRIEKTNGPWHQAFLADQRFVPLDSHFAGRLRQAHKRSREVGDQLAASSEQLLQALQAAV